MSKKQNLMMFGNRWAYLLAIASLFCIVIATIYPFNFAIPQNVSLSAIFNDFEHSSSLKDYANNIILFIPWGFSLAWILPHKKFTYFGILVIAIISSLAISSGVEFLQYFLPKRVSNFTDVTTNTIGGGIGPFLYWWRREIIGFIDTLISKNYQRFTPKSVGLVLIGYFVFINLIIAGLLLNINLNNWDNDFPLVIGNEATGDRPWQGRIKGLALSDRALTATEIQAAFEGEEVFSSESDNLIAAYSFSEQNPTQKTNFTNLVDGKSQLVWQQESSDRSVSNSENNSVTVNRDRWLKTAKPVSIINQKLQQTDRFTLSTIVATDDLEQAYYPRIVSISGDPHYRNFTVAQEQKNLMLRLRTPVTGENGNEPELIISNIFKDLQFHHLIITFDSNHLDVYLDSLKNKYSFTFPPETTFWSYFPIIIPSWQVNLSDPNKILYCLGFYSVLFIPLGFLGGILLSLLNRQKYTQLLLLTIICLLPALSIEQLYVTLSSQPIRSFNLLLGIGILLTSTILFKQLASRRRNINA
jgi:glycopeptide antibiotics resistance protein